MNDNELQKLTIAVAGLGLSTHKSFMAVASAVAEIAKSIENADKRHEAFKLTREAMSTNTEIIDRVREILAMAEEQRRDK